MNTASGSASRIPTLPLYGWSVESTACGVAELPSMFVGADPLSGTLWTCSPPDSALVTPVRTSPGPVTASFMAMSPTTSYGPNELPPSVDVNRSTAKPSGHTGAVAPTGRRPRDCRCPTTNGRRIVAPGVVIADVAVGSARGRAPRAAGRTSAIAGCPGRPRRRVAVPATSTASPGCAPGPIVMAAPAAAAAATGSRQRPAPRPAKGSAS